MNPQQKEAILTLLEIDKNNGGYQNKYWFPYKDFLDPADNFTDFSCENLGGKQRYLSVINHLLTKDETAKIYVEVYGFEADHNEPIIYADTLIIFSRLSLEEVRQTFNEPNDIFPSDIGEFTEPSQQISLVDHDGNLVSGDKLWDDSHSVYYCWWD